MAIFQQAANETKWPSLKSEQHPTSILIFRILLLLLILLHSLLFTFRSISYAVDEGGGTIGFEYRSTDQETFLSDQQQYEAISHLDLWQNVPNVGKLTLWLDWANAENTDDLNQLGRGFMALQGFRFNDFILDSLVGDSPIVFTNLPEKFSNLFYSDVYFRGARTDVFSQWGELHLFGGKVAQINDLFGTVYDTTGEVFYGFRGSYRPIPTLFLGTGFIRTQDEVDNSGRPATKSNNIFLFDSELLIFPWMKWLTDFRRSNFQGESRVQDQTDYSLVVGPLIRLNHFKLEANYRRIGTDYRFVSEATQGAKDEEGFFLSAEHNPWQDITLFGNVDRFRNNVSNESDRNTLETTRGLLGFSFFNPTYPSLFVTYNIADRQTRSSFPAPVNNVTATLSSEVRYQYKNSNPYVRYRWVNYDDDITSNNTYTQNFLTLGLRQNFDREFIPYIEGEVDRKDYQAHERNTRLSGKLGFDYYASSDFSCWGELIYSKLKERTEDTRRDSIQGAFGLNYQLPWDIAVSGDIRYDRALHPQPEALKSEGLEVTFRISKRFNWGIPGRVAGLRPGEETRGYGAVEGVVFNDINGNGLQEKGEEVIQNVSIRLEDRSVVKTDENGYYQFSRVEVGGHLVTLDVRRIPAEYSIVSPEKVRIDVRLRKMTRINFSLIAVGRIEGRIIFDANANAKKDPDERGVSDVLVVLEPGDLNTFTDQEGHFTLENVLPGKYVMKSDPKTLPDDAVFTSPEELRFEVPVGGELKDMDFLIFVKPRRIIIGPPTQ